MRGRQGAVSAGLEQLRGLRLAARCKSVVAQPAASSKRPSRPHRAHSRRYQKKAVADHSGRSPSQRHSPSQQHRPCVRRSAVAPAAQPPRGRTRASMLHHHHHHDHHHRSCPALAYEDAATARAAAMRAARGMEVASSSIHDHARVAKAAVTAAFVCTRRARKPCCPSAACGVRRPFLSGCQ